MLNISRTRSGHLISVLALKYLSSKGGSSVLTLKVVVEQISNEFQTLKREFSVNQPWILVPAVVAASNGRLSKKPSGCRTWNSFYFSYATKTYGRNTSSITDATSRSIILISHFSYMIKDLADPVYEFNGSRAKSMIPKCLEEGEAKWKTKKTERRMLGCKVFETTKRGREREIPRERKRDPERKRKNDPERERKKDPELERDPILPI
ncbi:hypothetical protein VNO77_04422 [Canavalia gladiata]|uniref:Uncharacterized protein n=1 Tax=Canavalia gladiata TaxID=3824 RepID=A0AAN9R7R9_CANGL